MLSVSFFGVIIYFYMCGHTKFLFMHLLSSSPHPSPAMMDMFKYLRRMLGCEYISDLRYEPYKTRAQQLLATVPLKGYPLGRVA